MKKTKVSVIGIGRVGLPLALILADSGFNVIGIGRDEKKIKSLISGKFPFIEKGGSSLLQKHLGKRFHPSTDYRDIKGSEYIVLTLGTPVDENMNPSYDQIDDSLGKIYPFLRKGQTLILRSTVAPQTTSYIQGIIERNKKFVVGRNFYLAFCPERISEGKALDEIRNIPQIIGGLDAKSSRKAKTLFDAIGAKSLLTDAVSAELAKLFTNMYRYINFAIANEFMILAHNYHKDIYKIVDLVNRDYKRGGLAGPGMTAGPCLFKDGFFLINDLPFADLISTSWKINESLPLFLIKLIRERMQLKGKRAVILGLAFKADIDDIRESLSFKVRKALIREKAEVFLHDPYVKEYQNAPIEKNVYEALKNADLIFIATNHKIYKTLDFKKIQKIVKKSCIVCDVWNVLGKDKIVFKINSIANEE